MTLTLCRGMPVLDAFYLAAEFIGDELNCLYLPHFSSDRYDFDFIRLLRSLRIE